MPPKFEFTPEINQDFYDRMASRISKRGETQAGQARSEALSRGLGGDPYEASAVGLARQGTQQELGDFDADLGYRMAGLQREERLTGEDRAYQDKRSEQDFLNRKELAQFGSQLEDQSYGRREALQNRRGYQGALWNLGAGLAAKGLTAML